jgi:signal transduction histidine kinase
MQEEGRMPRRLLAEPHLLAHELRTPLTVLAGWYSLIQAGDITPQHTPEKWGHAMDACERAVNRLNLIIKEACDEAEARIQVRSGPAQDEFIRMMDSAHEAVTHSREVLEQVQADRTKGALGTAGQGQSP